LHFYAVIEFAQYFVFPSVFALSALVFAAVFLRIFCRVFLRRVFSLFPSESFWLGIFLPVIHYARAPKVKRRAPWRGRPRVKDARVRIRTLRFSPQAERDLLARILGELGKLGSNVNQSAKWSNIEQAAPSFAELVKMREDIALMRAAVLQALARGDDRGD
jgi:hypothetical protein